jgi:thioredoxin 1
MSDSKNVKAVTDTLFQQDVVKNDQLSLVDFWAEWCGPCRMLSPTIDTIADEYSGKMQFYKMNVDENPQTPSQFHIRGIPTILFFKGGQLVDQLVGNQPKATIVQTIQKHI